MSVFFSFHALCFSTACFLACFLTLSCLLSVFLCDGSASGRTVAIHRDRSRSRSPRRDRGSGDAPAPVKSDGPQRRIINFSRADASLEWDRDKVSQSSLPSHRDRDRGDRFDRGGGDGIRGRGHGSSSSSSSTIATASLPSRNGGRDGPARASSSSDAMDTDAPKRPERAPEPPLVIPIEKPEKKEQKDPALQRRVCVMRACVCVCVCVCVAGRRHGVSVYSCLVRSLSSMLFMWYLPVCDVQNMRMMGMLQGHLAKAGSEIKQIKENVRVTPFPVLSSTSFMCVVCEN
jgi:hypothetical protein